MIAALLGRSVAGETREAWESAYADVTAHQLVDSAYAATTVAELDRCDLVALLAVGLPSIIRDLVTAPDGYTTTVETHLWTARSRLGALRSNPTGPQTEAMRVELEERRKAGRELGKTRRTERAERLRAAAQSP